MDTSNLQNRKIECAELIRFFYQSFASGDAEGMAACYHSEIVFEDPAFGILRGKEVAAMWRMLLDSKKSKLDIAFTDIVADDKKGSAKWVASYVFPATGRKVVNRVSASFEFKDGLIVRHTDHFSFWRWSGQALGSKGWLLGWTSWMQQKVQHKTRRALKKYQAG